MSKSNKWVSVGSADFKIALDGLKTLVTEQKEPARNVEQVVSAIKKTVREAIGPNGKKALGLLEQGMKLILEAQSGLRGDGLADEADDLGALLKELDSVSSRLHKKESMVRGEA